MSQSSLEEPFEKEIHTNVCGSNTGLLATALVSVFDINGARILLRALLDQGSTDALISETAAQILKLNRKSVNARVTGIGDKAQKSTQFIHLTIGPRFQSDFVFDVEAIILKKLTTFSGCDTIKNDFEFAKNLTLADPSFEQGSEIYIVLGCAEYARVIKNGLIKTETNQIAQNTELGWIISGAEHGLNANIVTLISNIELQKFMKAFFSSEEFENNDNDLSLTEEELYCEKHYEQTVTRNENGNFVVTLTFKNCLTQPDLGDSRKCAIATQFQLERRFDRNPKLGEEYCKFIREGLDLGHIEEVQFDPSEFCHYLPHHCVFKNSTTTALRVVYNASQKTSNGKSLNEQLAIGGINQRSSVALLLRFRLFKYAFTADIEKMYMQIMLNENQLDLHRFVYRFSKNEPMGDFRLKTVTFGTSNAPYLATRSLEELAALVKDTHPIAYRIILACMYK